MTLVGSGDGRSLKGRARSVRRLTEKEARKMLLVEFRYGSR